MATTGFGLLVHCMWDGKMGVKKILPSCTFPLSILIKTVYLFISYFSNCWKRLENRGLSGHFAYVNEKYSNRPHPFPAWLLTQHAYGSACALHTHPRIHNCEEEYADMG